MDYFYYKTDFKLSPAAENWIVDRFNKLDFKEYYHELYNFVKPITLWDLCPPGREINKFLKSVGLNSKFQNISTFISNGPKWYRGNPHIDIFREKNDYIPVLTRFNIPILFNPSDKMVWWRHFNIHESNLVEHQFEILGGISYTSLGVPGEDIDERWKYLGTPSHEESDLRPSAFVRTDCAHTVNVSPGPRLIVSVALNVDLDTIVEKLQAL